MKILYLSSLQLFQNLNGGSQVTRKYLNDLGKNNKILLITEDTCGEVLKNKLNLDKNIKILDNLSKNFIIKFFSPLTYFTILKQIYLNKPNLIIIDFPWYGMIGVVTKYVFSIPFFIRSHNIEYLRMKTMNKWFWNILKIYEIFIYKHANKIICISKLDRKTLETELHVASQKIKISKYVPDQKVFKNNIQTRNIIRKCLKIKNKFSIIYFGSLDYQPNVEAASIIKNIIAPTVLKQNKNIIFLIIGDNPNGLKSSKNIIFTGYVERIEDYINASDLVIAPIISGGGVRTKILESLSCNKKIIATKTAVEGIDTFGYRNLLFIENNWTDFTQKIIHIQKNTIL